MVFGKSNPQSSSEKKMHTCSCIPQLWSQLSHVLTLPICHRKIHLLSQSLLNLAEIADGAPRLAYNRRDLPQLSVSSIRSEGKRRGRPPRKNTASDRSTEENKTSDGESSVPSNLEEIIALFRRIQSSISKEGSVSTKKSSSNNAKVKQPLESVVNVLRKSPARKQVKGPLKGGDEILPRRTGAPKREARLKENSPGADLQLSRPPSSFVKRSPIPVPYTPKEKISEVQGEGSPIAVEVKDMELQRVDELKLIELKELAKSRGLKGYSKLKKGELVEQLKTFLQS